MDGPAPAQAQAQQARDAQAQNLVQARHQGLPVGLVQAVFNRRGENGSRAGGQCGDQQRGALHVEDGVLPAVTGGQHGAPFGGGQVEIRDDNGQVETLRQVQADGAGWNIRMAVMDSMGGDSRRVGKVYGQMT
jgi:hypothetical protein